MNRVYGRPFQKGHQTNKGRHLSEETKRKIGLANKGKIIHPNAQRYHPQTCLQCNKKFFRKIKRIFCSNRCHGENRKQNERIIKMCPVCNKEFAVIKYMSKREFCSMKCSIRERKEKGVWNKGIKWMEMRGENHPRWIKDRTQLQQYGQENLDRRSSAYKFWRQEVYKRDNFKCKINNQNCSGRIIAHHILGWHDFPELRYEVNNGITLCQAHHPLRRAQEKALSPFFVDLIQVSKELF